MNQTAKQLIEEHTINGCKPINSEAMSQYSADELSKTNKTPGQHLWRAGEPSPNPKGRPKGSRNAVSEAFLKDLYHVWDKRGMQVLEHVAANDPAKLLAAMVQVLPKDFQITVDQDQINWVINASPRLTEDEWRQQHNLIESDPQE